MKRDIRIILAVLLGGLLIGCIVLMASRDSAPVDSSKAASAKAASAPSSRIDSGQTPAPDASADPSVDPAGSSASPPNAASAAIVSGAVTAPGGPPPTRSGGRLVTRVSGGGRGSGEPEAGVAPPQFFELALDEVWVQGADDEGQVVKTGVASVAELRQLMDSRRSNAESIMPVAYETGEPRSELTRRLISPKITVKLDDGADPAKVAARAAARVYDLPDYAPGFVVLEARDGLAALRSMELLAGEGTIDHAELQFAVPTRPLQTVPANPDDQLFPRQWHLIPDFAGSPGAVAPGTDINVTAVWKYGATGGVRGTNIVIGIVDDGVEFAHPDLNVRADLSRGWGIPPATGEPRLTSDNHGTAVAGDAAARGNNARGVSGSAPDAAVASIRLLGAPATDTVTAEAMSHRDDAIQVKNNSWGFTLPFYPSGPLTLAALSNSVTTGRGGLGTIHLFAAGNSAERSDNANYAFLQNSVHTIAVGALDSLGRRSYYSNPGANLVVSGPSNGRAPALGKVTTDRTGSRGYNKGDGADLPDADYTSTFGGTSSATPTVAGVVALMLEANPLLGWRDVKEILLRSAKKVNASDPDWKKPVAPDYINHNHQHGAGLVDAEKAVNMARSWSKLGAETVLSLPLSTDGLRLPIPDDAPSGLVKTFVVPPTGNLRVEHVALAVSIRHASRGELRIVLRSPAGTESVLAATRIDPADDYYWIFTSVRHWGEYAAGSWTVTVSDLKAGVVGTLDAMTLTLRGTPSGAVNPPPAVTLLNPASGRPLRVDPGSAVLLEAEVTDLDASGAVSSMPIGNVEFLANGTRLSGSVTNPATGRYRLEWRPPQGTHQITVKATDVSGLHETSGAGVLDVNFAPAGIVRSSFAPPTADGEVRALAADRQGRFYVGGNFTQLNGVFPAGRVARLRPDGSVDPSFITAPGPDNLVRAVLFSDDALHRGLYIGGVFSNVSGQKRRALARLAVGQPGRQDGSLDPSFDAQIDGATSGSVVSVHALALEDDGSLLVGGSFSKVQGAARNNLARLRPDGSLDSFAPDVPGEVRALALQPDGKILVGGDFDRKILRLHRDGTIDTDFSVQRGSGFDGAVNAIAVAAPGGEIYVGGEFTRYGVRLNYNGLAKLHSSGALDWSFNAASGVRGPVNDVMVRPDGRILFSGNYDRVASETLRFSEMVGSVAQLESNGRFDAGFNPGGSGARLGTQGAPVLDSIGLPNGDVLLAGAFTSFNGEPRPRLAVVSGPRVDQPVLTSQPFRNIDAGEQLDLVFTGSGGTFELVDANGQTIPPPYSALPRGVLFDPSTGRLHGIPLDEGVHEIKVRVRNGASVGPTTTFLLYVNPKKITYDQWKRAWFTSMADLDNNAISGRAAVRNRQGLSNFLVYALGGDDPSGDKSHLLPDVRRETINRQEYLTLRAPRFAGADVQHVVEYATDLGQEWLPAEVLVAENPGDIKGRPPLPATEEKRQFLRLKISENPLR